MSYGSGSPIVDAFIIKYDQDGNFAWSKVCGGTGFDRATDVKATANGGFVVTGYTESYGFGGRDAFISAYDSNGVNTLSVAYGNTDDDEASSIIQTADGGYIIAGSTYQYRYGQTTSNDEPSWQKYQQQVLCNGARLCWPSLATGSSRSFKLPMAGWLQLVELVAISQIIETRF